MKQYEANVFVTFLVGPMLIFSPATSVLCIKPLDIWHIGNFLAQKPPPPPHTTTGLTINRTKQRRKSVSLDGPKTVREGGGRWMEAARGHSLRGPMSSSGLLYADVDNEETHKRPKQI